VRRYDIGDDIALTRGSWQRDGLVMRWVPNPTKPVRRELDLSTLIACPSCHAKVTESCKTKSGHTTFRHTSRLVGRLCKCGSSLPGQRRMCDECRDEANRMNKRAWAQRQKEAA
jgi:hypothetical protein